MACEAVSHSGGRGRPGAVGAVPSRWTGRCSLYRLAVHQPTVCRARLATIVVSIGIVGALVTNPLAASADSDPLTLRVDVSQTIGRTNENLVGVGATTTPAALGSLRVWTVRIDANLQ